MYIVIFITAPDKKEAKYIARELLRQKLAACVNILDNIESLFWWKGKIDSSKEALLVVKSKKSCLVKITKTVRARHSYQVPEIIGLPIIGGYKAYLNWINESLR